MKLLIFRTNFISKAKKSIVKDIQYLINNLKKEKGHGFRYAMDLTPLFDLCFVSFKLPFFMVRTGFVNYTYAQKALYILSAYYK